MASLPAEINHLIIQNLTDVVFYITVKGDEFRFHTVNPAFTRVTGVARELIEGKLVQEVIPPESHELVLGNYKKAINERTTIRWHEVSKYPTGTKQGNVTVVPLFDEKENCYALLGTVHDVTEINKAEENLQTLMNRISDGLVAFDSEFNYTYVNKMAGKLFNKNPEDLIGKNYWKEYPEAKGTPFANAYLKAMETQQFIEFDDLFDPWNRWFENRVFPSENGLTIYFSDITERIEKELEVMEAKVAAEEANSAKTNFLDIAAHELRNPATTVYLMLHALLIRLEHGETIDKEKLKNILVPVERLNRLVSDLLDTSRLQKDLVKLQKQEVDICKLLNDWLDELNLKFMDNQISIHCDESKLNLVIDEVRIYQVFSNLLDNAVKYSSPKSPIEVRATSTPTSVKISVTDVGEGIREEAIAHIFDPFDRGGMDIKQRYKGLGLGLSICKKIVDLHGGNIGVESKLGKGSTFYFELPREK